MADRQYRLAEAFKNYTGMLNGIYPCKDGVVTLPDHEGARPPKVLVEHYGAKRIQPAPQAPADKK